MKKLIDKNTVYYFVVLILLVGFGVYQFIMPQVDIFNNKKIQLTDLENAVNALNMQAQPVAPVQHNQDIPVTIFVSPYPGLDVESASVGLVEQLIQMIKGNNNKITEVAFSPKQEFGTDALSIDMSLIGNYTSVQNLLRQIYMWKYLSSIKTIAIKTEPDNPESLTVKLIIDLYVKKT